jgi:hypothetical protein
MKRYKLVEYDGDEDRIEAVLARSLNGSYRTPRLTITATEVELLTPGMFMALDVARNTITGWPGSTSILRGRPSPHPQAVTDGS